jgi:hypothetical protein
MDPIREGGAGGSDPSDTCYECRAERRVLELQGVPSMLNAILILAAIVAMVVLIRFWWPKGGE